MKRTATGLLIASLALAPLRYSCAADLLGLYLGGAAGQGQLEASENLGIPVGYVALFNQHATAFKLMAGIHPLPFLGAEVAYDDYGRAAGNYQYVSTVYFSKYAKYAATLSMKGESAFGVLYLPLSRFNLFAKNGRHHKRIHRKG